MDTLIYVLLAAPIIAYMAGYHKARSGDMLAHWNDGTDFGKLHATRILPNMFGFMCSAGVGMICIIAFGVVYLD